MPKKGKPNRKNSKKSDPKGKQPESQDKEDDQQQVVEPTPQPTPLCRDATEYMNLLRYSALPRSLTNSYKHLISVIGTVYEAAGTLDDVQDFNLWRKNGRLFLAAWTLWLQTITESSETMETFQCLNELAGLPNPDTTMGDFDSEVTEDGPSVIGEPTMEVRARYHKAMVKALAEIRRRPLKKNHFGMLVASVEFQVQAKALNRSILKNVMSGLVDWMIENPAGVVAETVIRQQWECDQRRIARGEDIYAFIPKDRTKVDEIPDGPNLNELFDKFWITAKK